MACLVPIEYCTARDSNAKAAEAIAADVFGSLNASAK
jgi:hypothetical protein